MPDDGRRYELIGGAIVMTPAPGVDHQRVSRRLQRLMEDAWPEMEIFNSGCPCPTSMSGEATAERLVHIWP